MDFSTVGSSKSRCEAHRRLGHKGHVFGSRDGIWTGQWASMHTRSRTTKPYAPQFVVMEQQHVIGEPSPGASVETNESLALMPERACNTESFLRQVKPVNRERVETIVPQDVTPEMEAPVLQSVLLDAERERAPGMRPFQIKVLGRSRDQLRVGPEKVDTRFHTHKSRY